MKNSPYIGVVLKKMHFWFDQGCLVTVFDGKIFTKFFKVTNASDYMWSGYVESTIGPSPPLPQGE